MSNPAGSNDRPGLLLRLLERNAFARLTLGIAALLGAAVTIGAASIQAWTWYDNRFRWTDNVENTLESLRANVTVEEFDSKLGRPKIVTSAKDTSHDGSMTQRIYQGRDFWVQAVADQGGSVVMFAITACNERIRPSLDIWNGRDRYVSLVLNETTVDNNLPLKASRYQWSISGATANSSIYAYYSAGNATNYQTYAWGQNDACPRKILANREDDYQVLFRNNDSGQAPASDVTAVGRNEPPAEVREVLSRMIINTVAVFGVEQETAAIPFQIGADRVLTRTLDSPRARLN